MYRVIALSNSSTDWKAPRRIWRRVMAEKKPSTALTHEAEVGVKWNVQRGRSASHLRTLGGIVVDDGVTNFSGRYGALDGVEEANELLVAMPSHATSDHGSVEDVERGEQIGRAVAL